MSGRYIPIKRSVDVIIDEKMQVLTELCVADRHNQNDIRCQLLEEIRKHPNTDPDFVVDRVAKALISKKFE
jgi:hypothetical protein